MDYGRRTIFYRRAVVNFSKEIGVDIFFERSGKSLAKSNAELRKWEQELETLVLPIAKLKMIDSIIWMNSNEHRLNNTFNLIRKDRLSHLHYRAYLTLEEEPIFNRYLKGEKISTGEQKTLIRGGLIDKNKILTEYGDLHRLAKKALSIQTSFLGMSITKYNGFKIPGTKPEKILTAHLEKTTNMKWVWFENGLHYAFAQIFYPPLYIALGLESCARPTGIMGRNLEKAFIESFTEDYFLSTVSSLRDEQLQLRVLIERGYSIPSAAEAALIYRALGYGFFRDIAIQDHDIPGMRSMGWPDLIGFSENSIRFVEVKTNDRLTFGQLRTFPFILERGVPLEVIQLT
ncbi:VRR-NUC domain-containing protein [Pseudomonas putida]|uniref:VRR-NUC domain-containing protein n=1 Tax=Pseudomonas putida TaxID=303 RepID=UPI002363F48A|nr:VRR-NUC domain-containing protein [Pseudomonas putida]MDD2038762.1 VRR-NUC domain-containing protein [Pseudomonas putida]MDD2044293.1 VRR-NUC domain-containing protein [Pseudomonas putida]